MSLHLTMLGTFEVRRAGVAIHDFRTQSARLLLAYLAIEADRPHERTHLASLLWPDVPPDQALSNLRQALHRLRQALEPSGAEGAVLLISRQTVQLNPSAIAYLDVAAFDAAITAAHRHHHRALQLCRLCAEQLRAALALYRDELLAGLGTGDSPLIEAWLQEQRERLHGERTFALETLVAHEQRRGDNQQAIVYLRRWLAVEPWCEDAHYKLMCALDAAGQHSAALRQFARCRAALAHEFGVEPAAQTIDLAEQIRRGRLRVGHAAPASRPAAPPALAGVRNTPPPVGAFFGRRHELGQIAEHLADPHCRLITLVGPGGVGKTRLAIEAAAADAYMFRGGAVWVPLAGIDRGSQIYGALAAALELPLSPARPAADQVCEQLRNAELLVLLDNCEQIADAYVAIGRLLAAAPGLAVLATSRAPLGLRAEWTLPIAGLAVPSSGTAPPADSYDAGQLFLQLARQVGAGLAAQADQRALIAECCRLVYGVPLAIEQVVFQLRWRSLAEIAAELRASLTRLATTMLDVPDRHRSMRAVFEWSWSLLPQDAQRDLARLAVFRGAFTLAAVSAVLNGAAPAAPPAAEVIDTLVQRSLLHHDQQGRYILHELVRQFAEQHLGVAEEATARARHAAFYLELVAGQEIALYGRAAMAAEMMIRAEIDNLRAAWRWALAAGRLDLARRAMLGLQRFLQRTNIEEGAQTFADAVEQVRGILTAADSPATRRALSGLLGCQATFLIALTRLAEAQTAAGEALALAEGHPLLIATSHLWYGKALVRSRDLAAAELHLARTANLSNRWGGDAGERRWAHLVRTHSLRLLGYIDHLRGNYAAAIERYKRCRRVYRALENPRYESHTLLLSAETQRCLGDYARAKAEYEQALDLVRGTGNLDIECLLFNNLGDVMTHLGCYEQAEGYLGQALALARYTCNPAAEANVHEGLSRVARHRGDQQLAETYARQALSQPDTSNHGWCLTTLANALEAQGHLSEAAQAFKESAHWWGTQSETDPIVEALAGLSRVALARGALSDAVAYADQIYRRLHSRLKLLEPQRVYLACWRAFHAADDPRAKEVLRRASALLADQAAQIHDPKLRWSFLEQVAAHREIMAAAVSHDKASSRGPTAIPQPWVQGA